MSAQLLDGEAFASQIHQQTARRVQALRQQGVTPGLVFIRVGEDPASRAYVSRKEKRAEEVGISSRTLVLPENTSLASLLRKIDALNADPKVHGILIQSPLPKGLPNDIVYARVSPAKDVDGFHPINFGKLLLDDPSGFLPAPLREFWKSCGLEKSPPPENMPWWWVAVRSWVVLWRCFWPGNPRGRIAPSPSPIPVPAISP